MRFRIEDLTVYFPYEYIYPEQFEYMVYLKMPTGTGKTITLLSLITSYQLAHPDVGKLIYCTRTVPEMEKVLAELGGLTAYRARVDAEDAAALVDMDDVASGGAEPGAADGRPADVGAGAPSLSPPGILALGLSSRKNMCVHPRIADAASRESVDAACRQLTASWVREKAGAAAGAPGGVPAAMPAPGTRPELCLFYEGLERRGGNALLPPGVYTLGSLRAHGKQHGLCPYFLARRMMAVANVVVYSYQYLLDPKVAGRVSAELAKDCIVVFDEAHNIDTVCIEALSVDLRAQTLEGAGRNLGRLAGMLDKVKATDAQRLTDEYARLVQGLVTQGVLPGAPRHGPGGVPPTNHEPAAVGGGEDWRAHPALPDDVLHEAVPGNIRKAEHFLAFLRRLLTFLQGRLSEEAVREQPPPAFAAELQEAVGTDAKALRFCYDRLTSLLKTLEVTDTEDFSPLSLVADFATLLGTYARGFSVIFEPYDERYPAIPDPVLQLACLDSSLAIKPVLERFRSIVITSGTLSPLDLYPRLLGFRPAVCHSLQMTLTRQCICPLVLTRGSDQMPISTQFALRGDPSVVRNYGRLIVELAACVPDGLVAFFVSYSYMDMVVGKWHETGVLQEIMAHKLLFIETVDVVETSLALDNYRRACDCGRGAVFLSVARGKVAEGIDFDRHYGRCVVMCGVPFQYTLSRTLLARLAFLRATFAIKEGDFLSFDAMRQVAQCVGRVIRSKADYGLMILADKRYCRRDKRDKLPQWIRAFLKEAHLNLSTDMAVCTARDFLRSMAQPFDAVAAGAQLLTQDRVAEFATKLAASQAAGGGAPLPPPPAGGRPSPMQIEGGR